MGCKPSTPSVGSQSPTAGPAVRLSDSSKLRSNLTTDEPNQIVGSTLLQADRIIVLGDSVFLPTTYAGGEQAIIEISINDKKMSVYQASLESQTSGLVPLSSAHRGYKNRMIRSGIS